MNFQKQGQDEPRQSIRLTSWRIAAILAAIVSYYLIYFVIDFSVLSPAMGKNSLLLESAIESLKGNGIGLDKAFYATAFLINLIPPPLRDPVIFSWGCLLSTIFIAHAKSARIAFLALLLVLPAEVFALRVAFKETISAALFLFVGICLRRSSHPRSIFFCLIPLIIYAHFVRTYYFITVAMAICFVLASLVQQSRYKKLILPIFLLLFFIGFALPSDLFQILQGSRDNNYLREGAIGSRTAFFNAVPPDDYAHFLINYIYAVLRLHIPILFFSTFKEYLMIAVIAAYAFVTVQALRSKQLNIRAASLIFLSHVSVLCLFEPDAGSYLRHFTGAFGIFVPFLANSESVASGSKKIFRRSARISVSGGSVFQLPTNR